MARNIITVSFATVFFLCSIHAKIFADELYLKDGTRVVGRIKLVDTGYEVSMKKGFIVYPFDRVERFIKGPLPEEEYPERLKAIDKNSAQDQYILGLWCKKNELEEKATEHFLKAARLKPDFEKAWKAAGYMKYLGRWYSIEDYHKLQGNVKYGNEWMKKEKAEELYKEQKIKVRRDYINKLSEKIFRAVRKDPSKLDLDDLAEKLSLMQPEIMPILRRQAADYNSNCRLLAITTLSMIDTMDSAEILCRRAKLEGRRKPLEAIARALATNSERKVIKHYLLSRLNDCEFIRHIRRLTFCLQEIADPEIIPTLISRVDSTVSTTTTKNRSEDPGTRDNIEPVKDDNEFLEDDDEGKGLPDDAKTSVGGGAKLDDRFEIDPVYPNYEALKLLTGKDFGLDAEKWTAWWEEVRYDFVFDSNKNARNEDSKSETEKALEKKDRPAKKPF